MYSQESTTLPTVYVACVDGLLPSQLNLFLPGKRGRGLSLLMDR